MRTIEVVEEPSDRNEATILAEPSLATGWIGQEADEAWKHLSELPDLDEELR